MRSELDVFINRGRELAAASELRWDFPTSPEGKVDPAHQWNLSRLRGSTAKPVVCLSQMSTYGPSLPVLDRLGRADLANGGSVKALPARWQDLFKSMVLHDQLVKLNKPQNAISNLGHALRILATCAGERDPGDLRADDVQLAFNVALLTGDSGKRGATLKALVSQWFDTYSLSKNCPLASYCVPIPAFGTAAQHEKLTQLIRRQVDYARPMALRSDLSQRHAAERLPDERSFWELVRIVFTEQPKTLSDAIRFCQYKLLIVTGLRVGELVNLPADALRRTEHLTPGGTAKERGLGVTHSVALRHFAEKQQDDEGQAGVMLREAFQQVPEIFREVVEATIDEVLRLTQPMRTVVAAQRVQQRLFPDLAPNALVPDWEMYSRLTGMAQISSQAPSPELLAAYRTSHDVARLAELRIEQRQLLDRYGRSRHIREYFNRAEDLYGRRLRRTIDGLPTAPERGQQHWMLVADAEAFARAHLPTKLPDWSAAPTSAGGLVQPEDFLFLYPARARAEELHGAVVDVERYFGVARTRTQDVVLQLGGRLFQRYSSPDDGPFEGLDPHSLRHLQNTELFRQGLSDAIVTKRFNRSSPAQSHVYDHRSLSEHLQAMDLPIAASEMGPKAQQAYALIAKGKINGPIVAEFLRIQGADGDDQAFAYLNAEVGALHFTPYGFCVNSFAVNPCPKHLECFNGCGHLVRSDHPSEIQNLTKLRDRLKSFVERIEAAPQKGPHFEIHLHHAKERYDGVLAALDAQPGARVFPDGHDRHLAASDGDGRAR
jgi:hypothetical protein